MLRRLLLLLPCLAAACRSGQPVEGLAPARDTGGPKIVFDLTRKPLAAIPFPNDVATRGDTGSPTGLRLNSTVAAPSNLELRTRTQLDQLDGFGTFAPITVSFEADIDVLDLVARQNDADPTNDAVYLVRIELEGKEMGLGELRGPVKLGMAGQAEILTDQESLLVLLVRKIRQTISLG